MSGLPVIVVRPEPGNAASVAAARAAGLDAVGIPLFAVEPVGWDAPGPDGFDGILAGSANVFRHGGKGLAALRGLPVHVVGEATAVAARKAGFTVESTGSGGLQKVLDAVPARSLLRLAGKERLALTPPPGMVVTTRTVYASRPLPMPPVLARRLAQPALVLLHSGEAARHFAAECDRLGLDRGRIALACLAPRIAELAGKGWADIGVAEARTDSALLALAGQMCQKVRFGGNGPQGQACRTTS